MNHLNRLHKNLKGKQHNRYKPQPKCNQLTAEYEPCDHVIFLFSVLFI